MNYSSDLFTEPPRGVTEVFSSAFIIVKEHWKPLGLLAVFQLLSIMGAALVLSIVTFFSAASYITALAATIQSLGGDGYGNRFRRSLLDYSIGISGTSRMVAGGGYYGYDQDMDNIFDPKVFFVLIGLVLLWIIVLSMVASVYIGAYYHCLATIYTGGHPNVKESMNHGTSRMWHVYFFQLLFSIVVFALLLLTVGLPASVSMPDINLGAIFFGGLIFLIVMVILSSLMAGATPSIVVERKSACQAFKRSFDLCKNFIGFIFCSQFTFHLAVMVISVIFNLMFNHLPGALAFIGHFLVNIVTSAVVPIFGFVIYMAVRIRHENATKEDLAYEIGNNTVAVGHVEMQGDDGMKGAEMI